MRERPHGWLPQILVLRRAGAMVAPCPFREVPFVRRVCLRLVLGRCARAQRIDYYPKLLCAVPFTRCAVPAARQVRCGARVLIGAALEMPRASSSRPFSSRRRGPAARAARHAAASHGQFHWRNDAYADFESFSRALVAARARTSARSGASARNRRSCPLARKGVHQRRHWEFFERCYEHLSAHRSTPYLSLDFSCGWRNAVPPHGDVIAERAGRAIASALFLATARLFYWQYWGATEHLPLLHSNAANYQAIEYADRARLQAFEGGAQGEHKLFRVCCPIEAFSAPGSPIQSSRAGGELLEPKPRGSRAMLNELCDHSPFKDMPKVRCGSGQVAIVTGGGSGFARESPHASRGRAKCDRRHQCAGGRARGQGDRSANSLPQTSRKAPTGKLVQAAGPSLEIVINQRRWNPPNKPYWKSRKASSTGFACT